MNYDERKQLKLIQCACLAETLSEESLVLWGTTFWCTGHVASKAALGLVRG
jgi:hypothetical protein